MVTMYHNIIPSLFSFRAAFIFYFYILKTVQSSVQCHNGMKVFSMENGNTICAPMIPNDCVESCEWNTTCALTSHYVAFRGRRTFVSGMILTKNSFLVQCCASMNTIVQMNAKQQPTCVWAPPLETVEEQSTLRFEPPLASNEYVRDILLERLTGGRVNIKAQICKFKVQRNNCDRSKMTADDSRFISLLLLRLSRTKDSINFGSSLEGKKNNSQIHELVLVDHTLSTQYPDFTQQATNEAVTIIGEVDNGNSTNDSMVESFQISSPISNEASSGVFAFGSDSVIINHENELKLTELMNKEFKVPNDGELKVFGSNSNKNNAASISPRIHIVKSSKSTKKHQNAAGPSFTQQHIARDAVEDWSWSPLRRSVISHALNNTIQELLPNFYRNRLMPFNQINPMENDIWSSDMNVQNQLRKPQLVPFNNDEFPIKNELQIRKIQHDRAIHRPSNYERQSFKGFYEFPQSAAPMPYSSPNHRRIEVTHSNNGQENMHSKFRIYPLSSVNQRFVTSEAKVIRRPPISYSNHQQRQLQMQNGLKQQINWKKAQSVASQQNENHWVVPHNFPQSETSWKQNFEPLQKIRTAIVGAETSTSLSSTNSAAALNGLLSCCQQQAPSCRHLCSKDVSKEEIKHALVSNQCAPLSMTSVIQCFPRYYNISSVTQCCKANAQHEASTQFTINSPFKTMTSTTPKLPEQCLSLCAPDFKLSFAHFACIDHISTIVECYRNLLQ